MIFFFFLEVLFSNHHSVKLGSRVRNHCYHLFDLPLVTLVLQVLKLNGSLSSLNSCRCWLRELYEVMARGSRVVFTGTLFSLVEFVIIQTLVLWFLCICLSLVIFKPFVNGLSFLELSFKFSYLASKRGFRLSECLLFFFFKALGSNARLDDTWINWNVIFLFACWQFLLQE